VNDNSIAPNSALYIDPTLDDAQRLRLAAELFTINRDEDARTVLRSLSNERKRQKARCLKAKSGDMAFGHGSRVSYKRPDGFAILAAAGWRCIYCGQRVVMAHLMELLSLRAPDLLPFSPAHRFKESFTHPAVVRCQPAIDHLESGARSGRWLDLDNLVAACAPCNEQKNDGLAPPLVPHVIDHWDGGSALFEALANGQANRFLNVVRDLKRGLNKAL
jgi:hypothetical protein